MHARLSQRIARSQQAVDVDPLVYHLDGTPALLLEGGLPEVLEVIALFADGRSPGLAGQAPHFVEHLPAGLDELASGWTREGECGHLG